MHIYVGNSVWHDRETFDGLNISIPGLTSSEIYQLVVNSDISWNCIDTVYLSSMGNDMLRGLDLDLAEYQVRLTVDYLLTKGVRDIVLLELPQIENGQINLDRDQARYQVIAQDYPAVYLAADIYRQQLAINSDYDQVHLNAQGRMVLKEHVVSVASGSAVYHTIADATGNHLGAHILDRTGIDLAFAQYLLTHSRDWIHAAELTIAAGYVDIIDIVGTYPEQILYRTFVDIY